MGTPLAERHGEVSPLALIGMAGRVAGAGMAAGKAATIRPSALLLAPVRE
jgi:hypothetical protein